jgi:hypothetical protein
MRKRLIKVLAPIAVIVAGAVFYLLTIGHCFLPLPGSTHYKDERLEFWCYSSYPLVMPQSSQTVSGSLERLAWEVKHPAHARLLATAKRLEAAAPNQDHGLRQVLEAMGYDFPPGCGASSGDIVPGWRITHYPSMLRRIQKDFQLKVTWKEPSGHGESSSPNQQGGANGRQPFSSETNRTSAVAASRRSP